MQVLDYSKLDRSDMKTDLFIKSASPLTPIGKDHKYNSMYTFIQAYKELANNDELNRMTATPQLQKFSKNLSFAETIKIGLLHTEYESISKQTLTQNKVSIDGTSIVRNTTDYIFNENTSTIVAPLTVNKRGLKTKFELESDFYFNNTQNSILEIKADFDNGTGFQTLSFNKPIQVNYTTEGKKNLTFKIVFSDGSTKTKTSSFKIQQSNSEANISQMVINEVISTETPNLSIYNGETSTKGLAEYEIFLGADNVLDKPIFIIDGFDPGDGRTTAGIYQLLSYDNNGVQENLADRIRSEENFDVIIINHPQYFILSDGSLQSLANSTDVNTDGVVDESDYPGSSLIDGGSDFIERNAMSTIEVINQINSQKVGNEQNVVIGPSMGGLISRYALSHMESTGQNHDTRLWLSLDSPHLGANVPIGFQHLFNYLGYGLDTPLGDQSIEAIRPIVEGMLKSGAARQMLRDQYESHLANGSTLDLDPAKLLPEAHEFGPLFYNRINNLTTSGYPESTRNVSMINGSGVGAAFKNKDGSDVTAGQQVLDVFMTVVPLIADAHLDAWATPTSGNTAKISEVWIDLPWLCFCDIETDESAQAPAYSNGMDAAPGGLYDIGALAGDFGGDATIDAFFAGLTSDYFNFIPDISSMALNGGSTSNWYQNINLGTGDEPWDATTTTNPNTPFVNWYIPTENEDHVALTTENVDFAWNEIVEPTPLDVSDNDITNNTIRLLKNPADGQQVSILSSLTNINELNITLYDVNGRQVFQQTKENTTTITIKPNVTNGLYFITVEDKKNTPLLNTKVVISN